MKTLTERFVAIQANYKQATSVPERIEQVRLLLYVSGDVFYKGDSARAKYYLQCAEKMCKEIEDDARAWDDIWNVGQCFTAIRKSLKDCE